MIQTKPPTLMHDSIGRAPRSAPVQCLSQVSAPFSRL